MKQKQIEAKNPRVESQQLGCVLSWAPEWGQLAGAGPGPEPAGLRGLLPGSPGPRAVLTVCQAVPTCGGGLPEQRTPQPPTALFSEHGGCDIKLPSRPGQAAVPGRLHTPVSTWL